MEIVKISMEQVLILLLFIAVGYTLGKTKIANSDHSKILSVLGVYVFIPANIFNSFSTRFTVEYLSEKYPLLIASAAITVVMILLSYPLGRLFTKNQYQQGIYRYSIVMPNYGYVGYALAEGIFGGEMLLNVMIFALPMSFYVYTLGFCDLTHSKINLKKLINPANIAIVLGAVWGIFGLPVPAVADTVFSKASACMGPVSMLLTGIVISQYALRDLFTNKKVYVMSVLRLLVLPCATAGVMLLLRIDPTVTAVALLVSAMPCGMNTIVFPKLVGEDCRTGAALTCVTSILCCITIPLCLWLFGVGL